MLKQAPRTVKHGRENSSMKSERRTMILVSASIVHVFRLVVLIHSPSFMVIGAGFSTHVLSSGTSAMRSKTQITRIMESGKSYVGAQSS